MMLFSEWLKLQGVSMDNPIVPLVRDAWFAGAKAYNQETQRPEVDASVLKDAARYRHIAEVFEGKRGIWGESRDSDFRTDEEIDAAIAAQSMNNGEPK